jgi:hypothetical protein
MENKVNIKKVERKIFKEDGVPNIFFHIQLQAKLKKQPIKIEI